MDLSSDVIVFLGITWQTSTFVIWVSAIIGFVSNIIVNRKAYYEAFKEKRLREIAAEAFNKAEKIAAMTPTKSDDKLLEYLKYGINAYRAAFKRKPSAEEIAYLRDKATAMAEADKLDKIKRSISNATPAVEFRSIAPISESVQIEIIKPAAKKINAKKITTKKPVAKKPAKRPVAKKK